MDMHARLLAGDNFGYPPELLLCSTDERVLDSHRAMNQSVAWHQPVPDAIAHYVHGTLFSEGYRDRMDKLHGINFEIRFPSESPFLFRRYEREAADAALLGCGMTPHELSFLFPEAEAKPLILSIEELALKARSLSPKAVRFHLRFHTRTKAPSESFHVDRNKTIFRGFDDHCAELCALKDCRTGGNDYDRRYYCDDKSKIYKLPKGAVAALTEPHREGTSPLPQPRFCAVVGALPL